MLIEIPDPEVLLGIIIAFLGGLFALYVFYKIKPRMEKKVGFDPSYLDRLEFYERQLIDMKIRLDSIDLGNFESKNEFNVRKEPRFELVSDEKQQLEDSLKRPKSLVKEKQKHEVLNMVEYVLRLITEKAMTSRDIQAASHRSREHTSRLLNKLYKEGLVDRNTQTKPYTYTITEKGRAKIASKEILQETVA